MRNPEHFDPQKLSRFSVIRVWYEFPGQRPEEKLFVVLKQTKETRGWACWCIKATSRTTKYEADPDLMKGVVFYAARALRFFYEKTIIDPEQYMQVWHAHLQKEADKNRYRIEGKMPDDFRAKLTTAINQSIVLEPKTAKLLLSLIAIE